MVIFLGRNSTVLPNYTFVSEHVQVLLLGVLSNFTVSHTVVSVNKSAKLMKVVADDFYRCLSNTATRNHRLISNSYLTVEVLEIR